MARTWRITLAAAGLILVLSLPALVESSYQLRLANVIGIYLLLVLGLNFILGYAGQLSFAQVGFFGIGSYAAAILTTDHGLSFWIGLLAAAAVSGLSALLIGIPTLKLRGHYFAFGTFAFGEVVRLLAVNWDTLTHGASGLSGIPAPAIGGFRFDTDASFYYLVVFFALLGIAVSARVERSKIGRAMFAIRESELAAEAMGIRTRQSKQTAFTLSAVFAGIAGALYAPLNTVISPDVFSFDVSVVVLVSLLLGGSGIITGAVLGTVLIVLLPEWLRFLDQYYMMIYGAGVVLLMVFMPQGLMGLMENLRVRRARAHAARAEAAPAGVGERTDRVAP
ncbi:MAG: branched-chain amino acid ABC transporter permease [Burkholderiales bacterium]|nr:branched-chain amino acid ABC transporter permease [Burkholderiales bacterium]OJX06172.1 MAG: hypothetical protein BGO72_04000 [Burkholderiales bacterium 70-64]